MNGKSIIFGGDARHRPDGNQISLVKDCGLTRIGSLPFGFKFGACNTFQDNDGKNRALLCFGWDGTYEIDGRTMHGMSNCHRCIMG